MKVSIHHMCRFKLPLCSLFFLQKMFQYIICVGSRSSNYPLLYLLSLVSIHHMCRFKLKLSQILLKCHKFQYIICVGSSYLLHSNSFFLFRFQYIICVGSSNFFRFSASWSRGFNTSYVSVQGRKYHQAKRNTRVSIHHMCRFKLQPLKYLR